jgi:hypothetical protein
MSAINRRKFLLLGSAAGGLAVFGGAAYVVTDQGHAWVREILHRGLPGYTLESRGLALFIDQYFADKNRKLKAFAAVEGVFNVKWAVPAGVAKEADEQERMILTDFLLGSDFFANYPPGPKQITYSGMPAACVSPFARF